MADQHTQQMALFYEKCQEKGYLDMLDSVQSLKAKVIATDLNLKYKNIADLYNQAQKCYQTVQTENEAKHQRELRLQEQRQKEKAREEARLQKERERRAVDGMLLVTLLSQEDEISESESGIRVYMRPDKSLYYTVNSGEKREGTPNITAEKSTTYSVAYQPSKAIYTGATVGGITMGGVHHTQAGYDLKGRRSGKGDITVKGKYEEFTLRWVKFSESLGERLKHDAEYNALTSNGVISCRTVSDYAPILLQSFANATDYQSRVNLSQEYAEECRLSYDHCVKIANLLRRIFSGRFPGSKQERYEKAVKLSEAELSAKLKEAKTLFEELEDYRDSARRAKEVAEKYEAILQAEKEKAILEKEEKAKKNKKRAVIAAIVASIFVCGAIALYCFVIPSIQYRKAVKLMEAEQYTQAIALFESLGSYSDSASRLEQCQIALIGEEEWNTFQNLQVGDTYTFGAYEQDNNSANGKEEIQWLVLARKGKKVLVISKYVLDSRPYHETKKDVTWETSTLRTWLNSEFLNSAFSEEEQTRILSVKVQAHGNTRWEGMSGHQTSPGNATQDQIFLLSVEEAEKYFDSDAARRCWATEYAVTNGAETLCATGRYKGGCLSCEQEGGASWWLRTPGAYQYFAAGVGSHGEIESYGGGVDVAHYDVRPVMWITLP